MVEVISQTKAFTLLESLLTLFIISFIAISLTSSINNIFHRVEETLFFLRFEYLYRDSQRLASVSQKAVVLELTKDGINNGIVEIELPKGISLEEKKIIFSKNGGNSSLSKIIFFTSDKQIQYQLYIGSGKYKKTVR